MRPVEYVSMTFSTYENTPNFDISSSNRILKDHGIQMGTDSHHLVLDLDHTLISSFEFGESSVYRAGSENSVTPILPNEYSDEHGLPELYHATISNVVVLIKLRPFVRSFIKCAAKKGFTLHVYTKGRRPYMEEVVRLIDPDRCIKGRLISRDDEPHGMRDNQKDIALLPHAALHHSVHHTVVLDDSPLVWSACTHLAEVVTATRYAFSDKFVCFLRSAEQSPNLRRSAYPRDSDLFLKGLADSVIPSAFERAVAKREARTSPQINGGWSMFETYMDEDQPTGSSSGMIIRTTTQDADEGYFDPQVVGASWSTTSSLLLSEDKAEKSSSKHQLNSSMNNVVSPVTKAAAVVRLNRREVLHCRFPSMEM